ncbi:MULTISPECIES: HPr family phosphocarrier protein [unclassified Paenibacillus]|uniref:HPr family phosphocarrier protein n=1 Tax=unclassified Paenibacillus TaxID=185978 RepID=UPI001C10048B|nr:MULTISPECIES: HPr family phosphocarrier protein [unclassified Paenibacillus]MBU5444907.1 HPr family phosphocarrier protein [Paenibacillus sp. MSJ-34]CAH0121739.1 Phosphocarrier protein HPr [Paenibacillus sp. CECT 9249]
MTARQLTIQNEQGFHVRPAQLFVDKANEFASKIQVKNENGDAADAKSMLELMTLGLVKGSSITIEAEGPDQQEAVDSLAQLVESKFGED